MISGFWVNDFAGARSCALQTAARGRDIAIITAMIIQGAAVDHLVLGRGVSKTFKNEHRFFSKHDIQLFSKTKKISKIVKLHRPIHLCGYTDYTKLFYLYTIA